MTVFATLLNEVVHRFLDILHDTAGEISSRLLMASSEAVRRPDAESVGGVGIHLNG
jgi:hypothetical protein